MSQFPPDPIPAWYKHVDYTGSNACHTYIQPDPAGVRLVRGGTQLGRADVNSRSEFAVTMLPL